MTAALHAPAAPASPSALRAALPAVGVCLGLWGIAQALQLVPEGTAGMVGFGFGLAAGAAVLAAVLHVHLLARPVSASGTKDYQAVVQGAQVTRALALGFLLKLLALSIGAVVLVLAGVKFPSVAAFAIAFATTALICQVWAAFGLSRQLVNAQHGTSGTPDPR